MTKHYHNLCELNHDVEESYAAHLIESVVQEDDLWMTSFVRPYKHVTRVWVAVDVALHEYHLTIQLTQLVQYLDIRQQHKELDEN